jgi:hypothetical protein
MAVVSLMHNSYDLFNYSSNNELIKDDLDVGFNDASHESASACFHQPIPLNFTLAPTIQFPFNIKTMLTNLSVQQLRQAANLKEQIETLNKELGAILGSTGVSAPSKAASPKHKMSAGHIAKIRAAQKARWAKVRAGKPAVVKSAVKPAKKKGTISAAGIARIKAAQKARWAVINAAKAKSAPKIAVKHAPVAKPVAKP